MKKAIFISFYEGWYEKRLEPIEELLKNEFEIVIVVSDFNHLKKAYIKEKEKKDNCTYIHVPSYNKNLSIARVFSYFSFGWSIEKILNYYKFDFIYLLLPPNNIANYCLKYKKRNKNIIYIVDLIDMWPESMPIGRLKYGLLGYVWKSMRNRSLLAADIIFTECNLYRDRLKKYLDDRRTQTNYLFKVQTKTEKNKIRQFLKDYENKILWQNSKKILIGYLGSINNILDIEKIIMLTKELIRTGYELSIKIIGDGDKKQLFEKELKNVGINVISYGRIFDELEKNQILGDCDFGLNIMKSTVSVGLTIKSIDYFSYGIPVINNIPGDTWKLVEDNQLGINVTDNINKFIVDIESSNISRKHIVEFFESKFTKEAYKNNVKSTLLRLVRK